MDIELFQSLVDAAFNLFVDMAQIMVEKFPITKPFSFAKDLKNRKRTKLLLQDSLA
jgi:hypothetical protein